MKNCFGLTPNSLYGDKAGSEEAARFNAMMPLLESSANNLLNPKLSVPKRTWPVPLLLALSVGKNSVSSSSCRRLKTRTEH